MTPEEQKAAEEAEAKAKAEAETAEAEAKAKAEAENIDYKAELEKATKRLEYADKAVETERARRLKAEAELGERNDENQVVDEERIRAIAAEEATRKLGKSEALALIAGRSRTPEERELILFHYDHSIIPTGNVVEDVDSAWALANKKRLQSDIEEARRSVASEASKGSGSGSGQPTRAETTATLTPEEEKLLLIHPPERRAEVRKKMLAAKVAV